MSSRTTAAAKRRRTNGGTATTTTTTATGDLTNDSFNAPEASTSAQPVGSHNGRDTSTYSSSTAGLGNTSTTSMMGSTSTASGLRRSARNLRSVDEMIGGKVQKVFLLDEDDDDEAPPARPLADDLSNGHKEGSGAASLARLNGNSTNHAAQGVGTKGKRKAQASPPPQPPPQATSSTSSYDAAKKRRKDEAEPLAQSSISKQYQDAMRAQHGNLAQSSISMQYERAMKQQRERDAAQMAPNSISQQYEQAMRAQQERQAAQGYPQTVPSGAVGDWSYHQQQPLAGYPSSSSTANYRGGYPSGGASLMPPVANGHASTANRQQILDSADQASRRLMYDRALQQQPPPAAPLPIDDKDGHFIVREGDWISDPRGGEHRYKILSQLGQGTFGKVVECFDRLQRRYVAIKVIRAIQKYRDASQIEIRVLRTLSENDPANENKCIHLLDTFSYRNHVCIVSELLGKSVFDFLKDNQFNPFPPAHIWSFGQQLLKSVAFLHRLNLVHTDLKPENILLVNSEYDYQPVSRRANARRRKVLKDTDIRLIDFGSATFNDEYHSQVVSTRHYRAPEIILNMGWSFPCDAWSVGCILIEFYTGEALFQTHDNLEHLAMMEQVLGPMPDSFRRKAETFKAEYFRNGRLDFPNNETPKASKKYVSGMRKLPDLLSKATTWKKHNERFLHLLRRLLEFDPAKRIKVSEALKHPYFELAPNEIPP
ncbi:kinase-like protein [Jaminaea rosea]|uniref:Kinase-like protein n=1 Tax=Jaminaea rosea TaxID=1569628 RepID=A0A316ULR6_9BASI|nr:kinase-like protein [Jaminaea rosea]PWN25748.1 kinase-like protein [Jaminaea rosea]